MYFVVFFCKDFSVKQYGDSTSKQYHLLSVSPREPTRDAATAAAHRTSAQRCAAPRLATPLCCWCVRQPVVLAFMGEIIKLRLAAKENALKCKWRKITLRLAPKSQFRVGLSCFQSVCVSVCVCVCMCVCVCFSLTFVSTSYDNLLSLTQTLEWRIHHANSYTLL